MDEATVPEALRDLRYPNATGLYGERVACGLSPHAPYTAGPGLLRAVHDEAGARDVPVAIHVAESLAEAELLRDGTGPLAGVASRMAHGFVAPGTSTVRYLADLGVLEGVTAVHLCHLTADDLPLLATQARGAVTCPRSNRHLGNPPPAIARLLEAGIAVGIGTDSSASNEDLDLMAEVRAVQAAEPRLSAECLIEIATLAGARAIGAEERFGSLERGKAADLALFQVDRPDDPIAATVEVAGRAATEAVMSAGSWRVLEGELLEHDRKAAARPADARLRSLEALHR